MGDEIWILGATGRSGRAIAAELIERGESLVAVGRDVGRLTAAVPGARTIVASSPAEMAANIVRERAAVVVNTVGPFQSTAGPIAEAVIRAGGDYVDLANDLATVSLLLGRHAEAERAGSTIVTGAGFGVTATESLATWLMTGRPPAERARVDMIPSFAIEEGALGEALAATLLDGLPGVAGGGRFQGRRIAEGRLIAAGIGSRAETFTTPDGDPVTTAGMPLGELVAAAKATQGRFVDAASSEAPHGALLRAVGPAALALLHIAPLRRYAIRRLAARRSPAAPRPREHSWARARIEWPDGTIREGWLRLGDAGVFTARVAAETAARLRAGQGRAGAFTPAALFGTTLAEAAGASFVPLALGEPPASVSAPR
jgi:short subunit dehydrogenase-like uncharacterized protein